MADYFKFAWRCVRQAWRGCWTKANEWAALLGGTIVFVILYFARHRLEELKFIEAPNTYWGVAGYGLVLAVASVVIAFFVIFIARLVLAPARLYWEQFRKAESLEADLAVARGSADLGPNWPIRELFFYLEPDALDRPHEKTMGEGGRAGSGCIIIRSSHGVGKAKQNQTGRLGRRARSPTAYC